MSVVLMELKTYNNFQRERHDSTAQKQSNSPFLYDIDKYTFDLPSLTLIPGAEVGSEVITHEYKLNGDDNQHLVSFMTIHAKSPALKLDPKLHGKYKIRMCDKLGNNIIKSGKMIVSDKNNNKTELSIDSHYLDLQMEWFLRPIPGAYEAKCKAIGYIEELTTWGNELPDYDLSIMQPWPYTTTRNNAFPTAKKVNGEYVKLNHQYVYNLELKDLLQVKEKRESGWVYLQSSEIDALFPTLFGVQTPRKLSTPLMYVKYLSVLDDHLKLIRDGNYEVYWLDVERCTHENFFKGGQSAPVKLEVNGALVYAVTMAQKVDFRERNIHSNYTNNPKIKKGKSPITHLGMKHLAKEKFKNIPFNFFERDDACQVASSLPHDPGYGLYAVSSTPYDPNQIGSSIDITSLGTSFDAKLQAGESDIQVMVYCLTLRKFTMTPTKISCDSGTTETK